jgi:hypothetical protein
MCRGGRQQHTIQHKGVDVRNREECFFIHWEGNQLVLRSCGNRQVTKSNSGPALESEIARRPGLTRQKPYIRTRSQDLGWMNLRAT